MSKLLKTFISTVITSSIALFSTSCESVDDPTLEQPIDITGKAFVDSYFVDEENEHAAGIETFEFGESGKFSNRIALCYLAGRYLTHSEEIVGMYTIKDNRVSLAYSTYTKTAVVKEVAGKIILKIDDGYSYTESDKTVLTLMNEFKKKHGEDNVLPVMEDAAEKIQVKTGLRFLAENDRKSLVITVDSVSGSLKDTTQVIDFRIENVPGNFRLTSGGSKCLVKIGKSGYATTDEAYALESPENVLIVLSDKEEFTIVSPSTIDKLKKKSKPTKFAPFVIPNYSIYD